MSSKESKPLLRWLGETFIMPLSVAGVGFWGSHIANNISIAHNKAEILKEFLPILVHGSAGERAVANVALSAYLNDIERKQIDIGIKQKIETQLITAIQMKDTKGGMDALNTFAILYPNSDPTLLNSQGPKGSTPTSAFLRNQLVDPAVRRTVDGWKTGKPCGGPFPPCGAK